MSGQTRTLKLNLTGHRHDVEVPADDRIFSSMGTKRLFRPYERLCGAVLVSESVVLDVGANVGLTAIIAAKRSSRVIAIEAAPSNYAVLTRNTASHVPGRVEAVHCAAGAADGTASFSDYSAFGHVRLNRNLTDLPVIEVPLHRIDTIVEQARLERLDLLKIDVEGFEQDVLEGAWATLARFQPLVFLEFNSFCQIALFDRNPRRLAEYLLDRFPEVHIWRGGRLMSVHELGIAPFLEMHMVKHRCLDDLVVTQRADWIARLRAASEPAGVFGRLRRRFSGRSSRG